MSTEEVKALVEELRFGAEYGCDADLIERAADAIEELVAKVADKDHLIQEQTYEIQRLRADVNRQKEKMIELAKKLPKRGEIVRCGECAHCYANGFVHERNICEKHPELGNVPDDWFCADGEREVQDETEIQG